jgi:hypothetical protein
MPHVPLSWLRQAAVNRIRFFEEALAERGLIARLGAELEFFPLSAHGLPKKNLLDEAKLTDHLRKTVTGIERVHKEIGPGAQYELVTGLNPTMKNLSLEHASALATAENVAAFQDAFAAHAPRWQMTGVSYCPRQKVLGKMENSGLHINISLWDKSGTKNLFYQRGQQTTDLERHVVDALIENHGNGSLIYLPTEDSFARVNSMRDPLRLSGLRNLSSGVPNTAGYMPSKGITLQAANIIMRDYVQTQQAMIPSITGRFRSPQGMVFGLVEKVTLGGVRSNMIGWETAAQHRLESRLAASDADPYLVVASEMAAIYDAVCKGTRINQATNALEILPHTTEFKLIGLPDSATKARLKLGANDRLRKLLGEDLFHGIIVREVTPDRLAEDFAESAAYVESHAQEVPHHATAITKQINDAFASLDTPLRATNQCWVDAVTSDPRLQSPRHSF